MSYVLMCLTLCWGIFTATGWIRRLTGYQSVRSFHMVLAIFTLSTGMTHAGIFLLLREQGLDLFSITVPFSGLFRHALGIFGLELMIGITVAVALKRFIAYRKWLRFHQLAYLAVAMIVVHSWFGAVANGHLAVLWLGGVTVLVPAVTLTVLRVLPPRWLIKAGLLTAAPAANASPVPQEYAVVPTGTGNRNGAVNGSSNGAVNGRTKIRVNVDNQRCKRYGICQAESPELFQLLEDGRLRYIRDPHTEDRAGAQAAARSCPMRAIKLQEVN
ncbi:MAG TPA: ferredoxin [Actinophytocola sp.]|uniref:ferredoxin n=1 Tax=Actinophytocola sp. TaxID=1872138 RepID=UPI002DBF3092|nr:ferredoxin [Actinophytocola sp.]HEU5471617.1 ferredoxin [Actinophytocola sp.]